MKIGETEKRKDRDTERVAGQRWIYKKRKSNSEKHEKDGAMRERKNEEIKMEVIKRGEDER